MWFLYSFPSLVLAIATPNDKHRVLFTMVGTTCAGLAAACRFQSAWRISGSEYDSQELRPVKPMIYFNKTNSDEYSAEVKKILESRKNKKNSPPAASVGGSGLFPWLRSGFAAAQKKQPKHKSVRVLLAGMK